MRIAINTSPLVTGHASRGIGWYTKRLVEALKKYAKSNDYILFSKKETRFDDINVIHFPYFDPFFLTLPLYTSKPIVVTVHDLIPLILPDGFPRGIRGETKWQIQRFLLQKATCIITDSRVSKDDIAKLTSFPKERIFVVYLAAGDEFKPRKVPSALAKTQLKYHLPKNFFLYVGDLNYHKNIFVFLKGFYELKEKVKSANLVIVGKAFLDSNLKQAQETKKLINTLRLNTSINFVGFVETEELVDLYNLATALVVPSLYEGFGLPLVEAISCGCPVIASDIRVHREIGASSITYLDPKAPNNISQALQEFLQKDQKSISYLKKSGLERAKFFSWKKVAKETTQVYQFANSYENHL